MSEYTLKYENINFSYPKDDAHTDNFKLANINFNINKGEVLGVAGESGSGKTTILKLTAGFIKPDSGEIKLNIKKKYGVQVLFQNSSEIINPYRKIKDVLEEAYKLHHPDSSNVNSEVISLLELVNLDESLLERRGSELSGGEQQRAALARILAAEPELLILDEPFSAQDYISHLNFIEIIKKLRAQKNISILCISHSLSSLKEFADKILILYKGKMIELNEAKKLEHFYSNFLAESEKYNLSKKEIDECLRRM